MDERISKAIDSSKYRLNLFNLKENLKIKVDTMLTVGSNGGVFKSTPELLTFVSMILDHGKSSVVLIDNNGNPIEIKDLKGFYEDLLDRYFQATNFYHTEYTKLRKARSATDQFSELLKDDQA